MGKTGTVIVAFTVFLLLLLWGTVFYQLHHDRSSVLDAARTNNDNLARAYSEHVLGTLRLLDQTLLGIKTEYEKNGVAPALQQRLQDASNIDAGALLLEVVDEDGDMLASNATRPNTAGFVGDREYFQAHAHGDAGQLYISVPIKGRITGNHTIIVLSRGIKKADGKFGGIVFVSFDPQFLSGFFNDLAISKNSAFCVVGSDMVIRNMIQGSGRASEQIGKSLAKSPLAVALAQDRKGDYTAVSLQDGVQRLFSYRTLPDYPLVVVASIGQPEVLADFHERKSWLIGGATALSLIFLAVAMFQLRRLTLQWRAEQALRQAQEVLVESQRVAKLGYVLHDMRTQRLYLSDSVFELRGVPRQEYFTVEEGVKFIAPEDRARYFATREAALAKREGFTIDLRVPMPNGALHWEQRVVHPQYDSRGELLRLLVVVQDITERKETELELSRSRDNMARAQQVASFGSFERDLLGNTTEWSDEMYRIMGLEKGAIVPGYDAIIALVHPDDRERFNTTTNAGIEGVVTGSLEFRLIRPDGVERIIYRENGLIFDDNDQAIRLYGSYQDVTDRRFAEERERELERQLLHSQKLEALGTLAGGIAHDLNNTLTPIMALSKITARQLEPGSRGRTNLETIFTASEQARDLVKRVLAFSRRDKVDKKLIDLGTMVTDALKLLRATIPTSIALDAQIADVPLIHADASQIYQIVTNLVSNAAQAIGDEIGAITITLDVVASDSQEMIQLSVSDTGEGMDEATQQRIFEPFFTTKQVGRGTGLGLSIIAGIVADHGGRIEVKSAPGKGARFDIFIRLPDAETDSVAA